MSANWKPNENPTRLIDWFDDFAGENEYAFLSNFYLAPVKWMGHDFPTSEHAFAWAKVDLDHKDARSWMEAIQNADGPDEAKSLGRRAPLCPDWEQAKFNIMTWIVWAKFTQHNDLAQRLLATGRAYLQEGTWWNDRVWGVDLSVEAGHPLARTGTNWLGMILMEVRAGLALL